MLRAAVIEDEPLAAHFLATLIERTGKAEVVGIARDGHWGLALCAEKSPEVAFVDIKMPGPDGIELASLLARLKKPPLIVFTTGNAGRACEAFRLNAVDYVMKPLDPAHIDDALCRLEARLAFGPERKDDRGDDRLPVKTTENTLQLLSRWEITAALHRGRRTWIHTAGSEFETYYSVADLLRWLGDPPFVRISRETIVNLQAIEEIVRYGDRLYQVRIADRLKTVADVSRSCSGFIAQLAKPSF
jgi:two-component system response regulator LytT